MEYCRPEFGLSLSHEMLGVSTRPTVFNRITGTLREVTTVACDGWIDVTSHKIRVTFYRRPSGTVCFRRVSRREGNSEIGKSSYTLFF